MIKQLLILFILLLFTFSCVGVDKSRYRDYNSKCEKTRIYDKWGKYKGYTETCK